MPFGDTITPSDIVRATINEWLNNPPDYHDVKAIYKRYGAIKKQVRLLQRDIEKTEKKIAAESTKPRSNETATAKAQATEVDRDTLAILEAELAEVESDVKFIEYQRVMYNAGSFQSRQLYE